MKKYWFSCLILILFSCGEKTKFTQLKKDWDGLLNEKKSEISDTVINSKPKDSVTIPRSSTKSATDFRSGNKRQDLVDFAKQYIGTPYKFACATPEEGFDCSGFLYFVYSHFGYDVPRSSTEYEFFGKEIPVNSAKRGDLVLFTPTENDITGNHIGHIGILINEKGMNSDFIHASSGKAGAVTISSLGSEHYTKRFVKVIDIMSK